MNPELLFELARMAISLARHMQTGEDDPFFIERLMQEIVQQGVDAYEEYTGLPIEPGLIHFEATL